VTRHALAFVSGERCQGIDEPSHRESASAPNTSPTRQEGNHLDDKISAEPLLAGRAVSVRQATRKSLLLLLVRVVRSVNRFNDNSPKV
jgi:hypothetical protein